MIVRFVLSDRELALAWLAEYYRRPGGRVFRAAAGPVLVGLGLSSLGGPGALRWVSYLLAGFGVWYTIKPFFGAWHAVRRRRAMGASDRAIEVRLDERGVGIDDGTVTRALEWTDVRAAGRGRGYLWIEVRGGSRFTLPDRALDDAPAVVELLKRHTDWVG